MTAPSTPRQPRAHDTRARILAAAVDAFAQQGYDGASTREIARRAHATQQLVTYHFGSKDELWYAAAAALFGEAARRLLERLGSVDELDARTRAELVIRGFVHVSAEMPQMNRFLLQEAKTDGPRMAFLVDTYVRPFFNVLTELFEELADQQACPAADPLHLYYLVTGGGAMMFAAAPECRRLSGRDPASAEVIRAHADCMVEVLLRR